VTETRVADENHLFCIHNSEGVNSRLATLVAPATYSVYELLCHAVVWIIKD